MISTSSFNTHVMITSEMLEGVAVVTTVVVVRSVLKVGDATMNILDEIPETPATLGWLNRSV